MHAIAINGSPRKKWNTAMMLNHALEGAAASGAQTTLIHLYDLTFKGCISCFECKKRNGRSYGRCAVKDDLTAVYAQIEQCNALILGSPIYFGDVTGALRSFMERLLFQYHVYSMPRQSLFPNKALRTALVYTMNAPEEVVAKIGYDRMFTAYENSMKMLFGRCESLMSCDTYQFEDYSKVVADGIDGEKKRKRREEVFPQDCRKAYEMGARLTRPAGGV